MSSSTQLLEKITAFCGSESLSEDGLREIIIIGLHGVAPNNNHPNIIDYAFFHEACRNEKVTDGVLRCLLEYFPNAIRYADERGRLPLHIICRNNSHVALGMVQLLIDAYPESVSHEDSKGWMPLHALCYNKFLDNKEVGLKILKLLIERCPESTRHANRDRRLPLHFAAAFQSPEFCRVLIEAYPGSGRITNGNGTLPFHRACAHNTVATVKYLYQLYPESINVANNDGYYPIHFAILGVKHRANNPKASIDMVQFLLDCYPNVALQKRKHKLPLYWVCVWTINEHSRKLHAYLKVLQILYDAHPEVIDEVASYVDRFCQEVQTFINNQLIYARQARDCTLMHSTDEDGRLPLHRALRGLINNVTLGSIKLLVKGNPSAVQSPDNGGASPLHLTCQHHNSTCIVEYLINLDPTSLCAVDGEGNTVLHYACRCAKFDTIALARQVWWCFGLEKEHEQSASNRPPL